LARQICGADPEVEDAAAFGERLHLRLRPAPAERGVLAPASGALERLPRDLAAAGVQVQDLRPIAPSLEDAFIALLQSGRGEATPTSPSPAAASPEVGRG
jgi:hypothetical protein